MTTGPEIPPPTDPREAAAANYRRWILFWGGYVRLFPVVYLVFFATRLARSYHEVGAAIVVATTLVFPLGVAGFLRRARPADLARPAPSFWNRIPPFLFGLALLADLATVARLFWDPPCRKANELWLQSWSVMRWTLVIATAALYVLAWFARTALIRKRRPAAPQLPRLAFLSRVVGFAAIQQMFLLWAFFLPGLFFTPPDPSYDGSVAEAADRAASAQERFRAAHGRYAGGLDDLVALDRSVGEDRAVTFHFGYAGDTQFTFTASHPKACRSQVRRK